MSRRKKTYNGIGEGKTVLIAHDRLMDPGTLRDTLENDFGCKVIFCENTAEILQVLKRHAVDVMVIDNRMPLYSMEMLSDLPGLDQELGITEHLKTVREKVGAGVALAEHIRAGGAGNHYADIPIVISTVQLENEAYEKVQSLNNVSVTDLDAQYQVEEILKSMAAGKDPPLAKIDPATNWKLKVGLSHAAICGQNKESPRDYNVGGTPLIQNDSDYMRELRKKAGMETRLPGQGASLPPTREK